MSQLIITHEARYEPLVTYDKDGNITSEHGYYEDKPIDPNEKLFISLLSARLRKQIPYLCGPTGKHIVKAMIDILHSGEEPDGTRKKWFNRTIRKLIRKNISDTAIKKVKDVFRPIYRKSLIEFAETGTLKGAKIFHRGMK
jgi:hypothetical protein